MDKKLNNLIEFEDFDKSWKPKQQKATKRTDVGLDILNEKAEEGVTDLDEIAENVIEFLRSEYNLTERQISIVIDILNENYR